MSSPLDYVLIHRGAPVPYITRWTSEVIKPGPAIVPRVDPGGNMRIYFEGELASDRVDGVLWLRSGDSPGVGEPMYKDVHSGRQRRCMLEGICQVCGQKIDPPVTWVIPAKLGRRDQRSGSVITDVAPVCGSCLPVAAHYCPFLDRTPIEVFEVRHWRPWAYWGEIVEPSNGIARQPLSLPRFAQVNHFKGERRVTAYTGNVMARQLVVQLWDYRRHKA